MGSKPVGVKLIGKGDNPAEWPASLRVQQHVGGV
jgi:hypothetical protein